MLYAHNLLPLLAHKHIIHAFHHRTQTPRTHAHMYRTYNQSRQHVYFLKQYKLDTAYNILHVNKQVHIIEKS